MQDSETQEVATQQETQTHVDDSQKKQTTSEDEEYRDRNWRQARQKMRDQEAQLKAQQQLIEQMKALNTPKNAEPELDENGYLNAGKTRELINREAEKIAEAKIQQALAERENSQFHQRLKTKFSDFDDVVNSESIALLEEEDPDFADAVSSTSDPYKAGLQVYKYLKTSPILDKLPSRKRKKEVDQKLKKNESDVPSPAQYEKRPMAQAFNMANEDSPKLWEEMMKYASMGSGY